MTKLNTQSADEFFKQVDILEVKLEKIKKICEEAPAIDSELSLRILEVIGAEDDN